MIRLPVDDQTELRLLRAHDAQELFQLIDHNREHLRKWMPWVDDTRSVQDSEQFRFQGLERFAENGSFDAGIFYRGGLAGAIGLHRIAWADRKTSIGYWIGEEFQGKGLVTMSCLVILDYAYEDLELNRIEIKVATGNTRSRAIPERLGFTHEGVLREDGWLYDHFVDHDVFSLLRREWLSRKQ